MGEGPYTKWTLLPTFPFATILLLAVLGLRETKSIRQAPFCVDETNTEPVEEGLFHFEDILRFHMNNSYIPVSDGKTSPGGLITKIELKGIEVDDKDSGYKDVLHNWIHFTIEAAIPIEGFYIQAIGAPWGTPFGEFILDFDCEDCSVPTSTYKHNYAIIPCIYRPALEYTHPNVFTFGGTRAYLKRALKQFKELHFNFRYTQYPGVEYTFAQFLIIAVRDFYHDASRFETFFTPIYRLGIAKNPMGAYYPFYLGWPAKHVKCHQVQLTGEIEREANISEKYKIRYNEAFDKCVVNKEGKDWYTCPPGPIKMATDEIPTDLKSWEELRAKYIMEAESKLDMAEGGPGSKGGVQFCADAGNWEYEKIFKWTAGQLKWPLPPNIIINKTESIELDEMVEDEDDLPRYSEEIDCDEWERHPGQFQKDPEIAEICTDIAAKACGDIHLTSCEANVDIPVPNYGKKNGVRVHANWDKLSFSEQFDEIGWRWGDQYVLNAHGHVLIFSVTVGFNIIAFVGRYMKEEKDAIEPKTSYFGIGKWAWLHMSVTYLIIGASAAGFFLVAHQNYKFSSYAENDLFNGPRDLCNVRTNVKQTDRCLNTIGHRIMGTICVVLFMLSYLSAWRRPKTPQLRTISIVYHVGCGYLSKLAGLGSIIFIGYSLRNATIVLLFLVELTSIIGFGFGECLVHASDRKFEETHEVSLKRKYWPVLEAVDLAEFPFNRVKTYLLYSFIFVQLMIFTIAIVHSELTTHELHEAVHSKS